jgi:hypothetical protein
MLAEQGNKDKRRHFLERTLEEKIVPAIFRTADNRALETVNPVTGLFDSTPNEALIAGYTPMITLLAAEFLGRKDLFDKYERFIRNLSKEPGVGYRIFRLIDPLTEFMKARERHSFSAQTIDAASETYEGAKKALLTTFFDDSLGYFTSMAKEVPDDKRYAHIMRADSYFIAKHARHFAPREYIRHVENFIDILAVDDRIYDWVYFNVRGGKAVDIKPVSGYDGKIDKDGRFFCYGLEQCQAIDMLLDYHELTGKGKDMIERMITNFFLNLESKEEVPEHLLSNEDLGKGIKRPGQYSRANDLPYALLMSSLSGRQQSFRPDIEPDICRMFSFMDLDTEGLYKNSTLTFLSNPTIIIPGTYYSLKAIKNSVEKNEKKNPA